MGNDAAVSISSGSQPASMSTIPRSTAPQPIQPTQPNQETQPVVQPTQTTEPHSSTSSHRPSSSLQQPLEPVEPPLPTLPQKRQYDSMMATLVQDEQGLIHFDPTHIHAQPCYGPASLKQKLHSKIQHLKQQRTSKQAPDMTLHKQGLSRQEQKALDREIPWRTILAMPPKYVDKFLATINKEVTSWLEWNSVEPLTPEQANQVYKDPKLAKRIIPARACYRDKACGIGEVKAKWRVVALGHLDPDLATLNRNSGTPSRCTEQIMYAMLVAGLNQELFDTAMAWKAWTGDASTAFLQGRNTDRVLPLFLKLPADGLIAMTGMWTSPLYRIRGNVYGLADALTTWNKEVSQRLCSIGFTQHDFDRQLYLLRKDDQLIAAIIVYVDNFLGISRCDHDLDSVLKLFKWGSLNYFELDKAIVFKGKEQTLKKNDKNRYYLHITLKKFLEGIDFGDIPKGRMKQPPQLSVEERKELRSIGGCLQWAATQTRPEIAATVSLSAHGDEATIQDLK